MLINSHQQRLPRANQTACWSRSGANKVLTPEDLIQLFTHFAGHWFLWVPQNVTLSSTKALVKHNSLTQCTVIQYKTDSAEALKEQISCNIFLLFAKIRLLYALHICWCWKNKRNENNCITQWNQPHKESIYIHKSSNARSYLNTIKEDSGSE